jgi:hypothetical protein
MVLKFSSLVLNIEYHFRRDTVPLLALSKYLFIIRHIIHQSVLVRASQDICRLALKLRSLVTNRANFLVMLAGEGS